MAKRSAAMRLRFMPAPIKLGLGMAPEAANHTSTDGAKARSCRTVGSRYNAGLRIGSERSASWLK